VTGHEAQNVIRIAETLRIKLDALEIMSGKEKDSGLKSFSVVRRSIFSVVDIYITCLL
jgi:alanyl-tRNA synthetase